MKLKDVIDANFHRAVSELSRAPIPVVVGYGMTTLLDRIEEERKKFETLRIKLLKKYGELDEKGNPKANAEGKEYILKDREAFDSEYAQLLDIEVDLPKIRIDDIKDLKLSLACVRYLKPLIIP